MVKSQSLLITWFPISHKSSNRYKNKEKTITTTTPRPPSPLASQSPLIQGIFFVSDFWKSNKSLSIHKKLLLFYLIITNF